MLLAEGDSAQETAAVPLGTPEHAVRWNQHHFLSLPPLINKYSTNVAATGD